ncbi:hypothetical protein L9F63_008258, partial [Diploptera punctata]
VHARIASYLHAHATTQRDSRRARKELERNRRTTLLLSGIAVLFAVSWLPLAFAMATNIVGVVSRGLSRGFECLNS